MNKELIVANRPKSGLSEALKIVRTNLQFASVDQKLQNLLVTSSINFLNALFIKEINLLNNSAIFPKNFFTISLSYLFY